MDEMRISTTNVDRRRFLRKAAIAGGTVWVAPAVVSMRPAGAAELNSPPPSGVQGEQVTQPAPTDPPAIGGSGLSSDLGAQPVRVMGTSTSSRQALPRTGADADELLALGLTAVAGGGALMVWTADAARTARTAGADAVGPGPVPPTDDAPSP